MFAALLFAPACSAEPEPPARNLLLITIDTLRADHLGCYGYERGTSPAIDALAARSVLFESARATSSWTLPTLASLLTSTYPPTHDCRKTNSALGLGLDTAAEVLAQAGFRTGAIVNHIFLDERYGFAQGFTDYDQELVLDTAGASHRAITSPRVTEKAVQWLEERAADPQGPRWFLWVHYFDPHGLYMFHEGITERFTADDPDGPPWKPLDLYDGEIAFTDRSVGELLDELERLDFDADTVILLVADHGEAFGEHDSEGHRKTLHGVTVRVPCLLRVPGLAPQRFEPHVSTIDLLPTTLAALGVSSPPTAAGRDLLPVLVGQEEHVPRPIVAELVLPVRTLTSVQHGDWKLIRNENSGELLLYDLSVDPEELENRAAEHPRMAQALSRLLDEEFVAAEQRYEQAGPGRKALLHAEDMRRLESLGYGDSGD